MNMVRVIEFEDSRPAPRDGEERSAYRDAGRRAVAGVLGVEQLVDDFEATHRAQIEGANFDPDLHDEPSPQAKARLAAGLVFAEDVDNVVLAVASADERRAIKQAGEAFERERLARYDRLGPTSIL